MGYALFSCEVEAAPLPPSDEAVGIDFGLIAVEDLTVKGLAGSMLARSVNDAASRRADVIRKRHD